MSVSITEAESKILSLLWEQSPLTVAEITAALREKTGWDRHSVISLLKRMQAKGTVCVEDAKPARRYSPLVDRNEARLEQARGLMDKFFDGKPVRMMSAMVQGGQLSPQDIDELMRMLEKAREEHQKTTGGVYVCAVPDDVKPHIEGIL